MYKITTFYKFQKIDDPLGFKELLKPYCQNIKGTILVATEGINATVGGPHEDIDQLINFLDSLIKGGLTHKISYADINPFYRMKIRIKKEIVALKHPVSGNVGEYIDPKDWNTLIDDPQTILVDTRNDYEYNIGTFKGAINPKTESFSEFPQYVKDHLMAHKDKKIAMFCTGGIRCEKSTAYLKDLGFKDVCHLHGGILKYLEDVPQEESLWQGECFVFDQRVSVLEKVEQGKFKICFACRHPLSEEALKSPHFEEGVSCPKCYYTLTEEKKRGFRDRQKQIMLAHARGENHFGPRQNNQR